MDVNERFAEIYAEHYAELRRALRADLAKCGFKGIVDGAVRDAYRPSLEATRTRAATVVMGRVSVVLQSEEWGR